MSLAPQQPMIPAGRIGCRCGGEAAPFIAAGGLSGAGPSSWLCSPRRGPFGESTGESVLGNVLPRLARPATGNIIEES
jgi:hypothetical protein